jgi:hypothetical protein
METNNKQLMDVVKEMSVEEAEAVLNAFKNHKEKLVRFADGSNLEMITLDDFATICNRAVESFKETLPPVKSMNYKYGIGIAIGAVTAGATIVATQKLMKWKKLKKEAEELLETEGEC